MPNIGDKVRISGTGTFWDGKEGTVKDTFGDGSCTVALDFGNGRETLQDFDGEYAESIQGENNMDNKVSEKRKLSEAVGSDVRAKALADYLRIDVDEVVQSAYDDREYETPEGDYLVLTEDEAYDRALEDIQNTIDDLGLEAFTENFRDYILNNLLDDYRIREEAIVQDYEGYIEDIEQEPSVDFENRLIEELYDNGFLDDGDFEDGEDGKKDHYMLKPTVDLDDKKYEYAKSLAEDVIVYDWLYDTFGRDEKEMADWLEDNGYIDWDEVKRQCIRNDGIAHFIASYDGNEIELEGDLYAYRTN